MPPKHRACEHQLEGNVVECPVSCKDRCEPTGHNICVTWDKTKQQYYLHINSSIVTLMEFYIIIREGFNKKKIRKKKMKSYDSFHTAEDGVRSDLLAAGWIF